MECPFCKDDLSTLYDRGLDAIVQESCDHFLAVVDIACNTAYGPLAARVAEFEGLVHDAFAKRLHAGQKVAWVNLEVQSLWESVQEQWLEECDESCISPTAEDLYRMVLGFLVACGGDLVGPDMYSAATWRFMYAAKPRHTIEDALALLRSELDHVIVEEPPLRKRRR